MRTKSFIAVTVAVAGLLFVGMFGPASAQPPATPKGQPPGFGGNGGQRKAPEILPAPAGVTPLSPDIFTSKNFYLDKDKWLNKYYFRCNQPVRITEIWNERRIGPNPPQSASWGDCTQDMDAAKIRSPYPYKTAKEHYEALMAAARTKGGPTVYTKANVPDWDGYYRRENATNNTTQWLWGHLQSSTMLSLMTPEYQKRMVQLTYHEAVTNAPQWNASFCYPEGFTRWFSQYSRGGDFQLTMSTWNVQFLSGIADNFVRQVLVGKQAHVQTTPQWYGETIGFWDGDTLITWTAKVQGWTLTHAMFENSDKMEAIELWKPAKDAQGNFIGLDHESIFYDPDAFVAPLRGTFRFTRTATAADPKARFNFIECLSNIQNTEGRPAQLTAADSRFVDYYGRPWAKNWEKYFEKGWEKPNEELAPELDIFGK